LVELGVATVSRKARDVVQKNPAKYSNTGLLAQYLGKNCKKGCKMRQNHEIRATERHDIQAYRSDEIEAKKPAR
jgi:hypothetical protein